MKTEPGSDNPRPHGLIKQTPQEIALTSLEAKLQRLRSADASAAEIARERQRVRGLEIGFAYLFVRLPKNYLHVKPEYLKEFTETEIAALAERLYGHARARQWRDFALWTVFPVFGWYAIGTTLCRIKEPFYAGEKHYWLRNFYVRPYGYRHLYRILNRMKGGGFAGWLRGEIEANFIDFSD